MLYVKTIFIGENPLKITQAFQLALKIPINACL